MIAYLNKALTFPSLICRIHFSFSQNHLLELHQAILATRIIKIIKECDENLERTHDDLSLKCRVLDEINKYPGQSNLQERRILETVKFRMLSYFVPQRQVISRDGLGMNASEYETYQEKLHRRFEFKCQEFYEEKFCPTKTVTGKIFKSLTGTQNYTLLIGQRLTGKTYSLILYRMLSDIIFQYKNLDVKDHPQELVSQVDFTIPKLIYYRSQIANVFCKQWFKRMIDQQCYELDKADAQIKKAVIEGKQKLQEIYWKLFKNKLALVFDGFDVLDYYIRFERYLEKHPALTQQQYKQCKDSIEKNCSDENDRKLENITLKPARSSRKQVRCRKDSAEALRELISNENFDKVLLLSAQRIDSDIMSKINLPKYSNHNEMKTIYMPFSEISLTDTAYEDAVQLIVHQLQLAIDRELAKEETYKNLPKGTPIDPIYYEKLFNHTRKFLKTLAKSHKSVIFLSAVTEHFFGENSQKGFLSLIAPDFNEQRINEKLKLIFKRIQHRFSERYFQKLNNFLNFNFGHGVRSIIQLKLFLTAFQKINHLQVQSITALREPIKIKVELNEEQKQQIFHPTKSGRQVLFYEPQTSEFTCFIHPIWLIRYYYSASFITYIKLIYKHSPKLFEQIFENQNELRFFVNELLMEMIKFEDTTIQFTIPQQNPKELNNQQVVRYQSICRKSFCFISSPNKAVKIKDKFNFLQSFEKFFLLFDNTEVCLSKKKGRLFYPLAQQYHSCFQDFVKKILEKQGPDQIFANQFDRKPPISFILINQVEKEQKEICIRAFGVAVNQKQVIQRIDEFIDAFLNFNDKNKTEITINNNSSSSVCLDFIVLAPNEIPIDWQKHIERKILKMKQQINQMKVNNENEEIILELSEMVRYLEQLEIKNQKNFFFVNSKGNKKNEEQNILLRCVGVVSYLDNLKFHSNNEEKNLEICQNIIQLLKNNRQKINQLAKATESQNEASQIEKLKQKVTELMMLKQQMLNQNKQLEKEIVSLKQTKEKLQDQSLKSRSQVYSLKSTIQLLSKEKISLFQQIILLSKDRQGLNGEINRLKDQHQNTIKEKNDEIEDYKHKFTEKNDSLMMKIQQINNQKDKINIQHHQVCKENRQLKTQKQQLITQNQQWRNQNNGLKTQYQLISKDNAQLLNSNSELQIKQKELEGLLSKSNSQLAKLTEFIAANVNTNSATKDDLKIIEILTKQLSTQKTLHKQAQLKIAMMKFNLEKSQRLNSWLQEKVKSQILELSTLKHELSQIEKKHKFIKNSNDMMKADSEINNTV